MKTQTSTPETRWAKRSLHQQLLHKFLNEYGYERGPVVAHAIIADILTLVEQAYATDLPPRHVTGPRWRYNGATGKTPEIRDLVHVRLHLVTDAEVALLSADQGVDQPPARAPSINSVSSAGVRRRMTRACPDPLGFVVAQRPGRVLRGNCCANMSRNMP
ncbi:MAG: hypothetical protein IPM84_23725 [Anaerolineae bacterium]|nr:hypothetical protein [Anaerolineae bacterium]